MSKQQPPSPNDDRANVKTPNNPAHSANDGNRGGQMNPQHPNYNGGNSPTPGGKPADKKK
jgi:hypothetical protein